MNIKIPGFLRHLPLYGGLPVPYLVQIDAAGKPDFRVINAAKTADCYRRKLCGICGHKMLNRYWFIGGEKSMASGVFTDAPMHRACAEFSIQICPYINGKLAGHRTTNLPADVSVNKAMETVRPSRMAMRRAAQYSLTMQDSHMLFQVSRWSGKPLWF